MKKMLNSIALIIVLLLLAAAVLAVMAGTEEGANKISEVLYSVTSGKVELTPEEIGKWGLKLGEGYYSLEDNSMFEDGYEIYSGDFQHLSIDVGAQKLSVEAGGCVLCFAQSPDGTFYAEGVNVGKFQAYTQESVLKIKISGAMVKPEDYTNSKVTVYIPSGYMFVRADVEVGAGLVDMKGICAGTMNLEVDAGQLSATGTQATCCNLKVGMGQLILEGDILEELNAECSVGNLELSLVGLETDFNYTIKGAMGNVTIGEKEYSGKMQDEIINNSANKNCNIQCAMGNTNITFTGRQ